MKRVLSKYVNPDFFIKRLKFQIATKELAQSIREDRFCRQIREVEKQVQSARGECVANWRLGIIDKQSAGSRILGEFRVNEQIAIIGVVTRVEETVDSTGEAASEVTYKRLETRRIKGK